MKKLEVENFPAPVQRLVYKQFPSTVSGAIDKKPQLVDTLTGALKGEEQLLAAINKHHCIAKVG